MRNVHLGIAATLAAAGLACTAVADQGDDILTIGNDAPAMEISHWVKGEPVESFENGKIYVVEFWATWCGPCKASMPHVTALQKEYSSDDYNVRFIGISDEKLPTVVEFLASEDNEGTRWYDKMGYTVATDPDRSVFKDYMTAAGRNGIPCAFIVGKTGKIEWIGHPMTIDEPIREVVDGTWDREAFKVEFEESAKKQRVLTKYMQAYREANAQGDWKKAVDALDQIIALGDDYSFYKIMKFQTLLANSDDAKAAYAYGADVMKQQWDDPQALNSIAWYVVDDEAVKDRNLDFAMKAAKRASELTNDVDAAILDTVARVYYKQGDLAKALKWQKKAVENSQPGPMADELKQRLEEYESENNRN